MKQEAVDILLDHQVKPSVQRVAILEYLLMHRTHPTVEEIYSALSPEIMTLSRTTVYNNLKLLTDQNVILTLNIDDKYTCYDAETSPHAHFLCKKCGKVYDLPINDDVSLLKSNCQHKILEKHYYYKGICQSCISRTKSD